MVKPENEKLVESHRSVGFGAGIILLFIGVTLAPAITARGSFGAFLLSYGVAVAGWLLLSGSRKRVSLVAILIIAAGLRLMVLFPEPALSGDVFRYRWDGLMFSRGINPYAHAPDAPALTALRTSWHDSINHPSIPTLYPPLAQIVFLGWAWLGGSLIVWRLILLVADLLVIRILAAEQKDEAALGWATFPLLLMEGHWSAHLEVLVVLALMSSWRMTRRGRNGVSGMLIAAAAALKVVPLVALAPLLRWSRDRKRMIAGVIAMLAAVVVPFLLTGALMPGFGEYARRWSFNSPAYTLALTTWESVEVHPALAEVCRGISSSNAWSALCNQIHPAMLARLTLAVALVAALVLIVRRSSTLEGGIAGSLAALLLLSPTIHPWYWLPLIPFAMMANLRWMIWIGLASPVSYLLYQSDGGEWPVLLLCYLAPIVIALVPRVYGSTSDLRLRVINRWMASRGESSS